MNVILLEINRNYCKKLYKYKYECHITRNKSKLREKMSVNSLDIERKEYS
jgi:hypothetical protein